MEPPTTSARRDVRRDVIARYGLEPSPPRVGALSAPSGRGGCPLHACSRSRLRPCLSPCLVLAPYVGVASANRVQAVRDSQAGSLAAQWLPESITQARRQSRS